MTRILYKLSTYLSNPPPLARLKTHNKKNNKKKEKKSRGVCKSHICMVSSIFIGTNNKTKVKNNEDYRGKKMLK